MSGGSSSLAMNQSPRASSVSADQSSSTVATEASSETAPPVAAVVPSANPDSAMSPFDSHLTKLLQHTFEWLYLLLLLLLLLYIVYRVRKWMRERQAAQQGRDETYNP
jgi:hypothetical protein